MSLYGIRTVMLLGLLSAILLGIGLFFAGVFGITVGLFIAVIMNVAMYFYSDKIVLNIYKAKPLENKKINEIIEKLSKKANIAKPKTYLIKMNTPNAFATGRNPAHAVVAVTQGLLDELNEHEIEGVLAHEISHIKHRDTLVNTIAATIGTTISWVGYLFWFGSDNRNIISYLLLVILAPIASMLVRFGISRSREYFADYEGAQLSNPIYLANALHKISPLTVPIARINIVLFTCHASVIDLLSINDLLLL